MKEKQDIFLEYFNPLKKNLWKFCLSISSTKEDAKDLLQDTIETAYKGFDKLEHKEAFLSWLFTVAVRRHQRTKYKQSRIVEPGPDDFSYLVSPDTSYEKSAEIEELYKALNMLSPEIKESLLLQEVFGFSQIEIGSIQGISVSALKQRLHRAKKMLREILEKRFNEVISS